MAGPAVATKVRTAIAIPALPGFPVTLETYGGTNSTTNEPRAAPVVKFVIIHGSKPEPCPMGRRAAAAPLTSVGEARWFEESACDIAQLVRRKSGSCHDPSNAGSSGP